MHPEATMKDTARLGSALSLFSVALLTGCVSTSFTASRDLNATALPKIAPGEVRVLAVEPASPFHTLGEIEANVSGFLSYEAVLKSVRKRAASVGANAVVSASTGHAFLVNAEKEKPVVYWFTAIRLADEPH
jgi:hypothetical protein